MRTSRDQRSLPVCFCCVKRPRPSLLAGEIDLAIIIMHKRPSGLATRPNHRKEPKDLPIRICTTRHTKVKRLTLHASKICRQYLLVSTPFDMGIYLRSTSAERVPTMACLRLPDGRPPLGLDGDGEGGNRTSSDLLRFTGPDDDSKCCARGLGYS